MSAPPPRPLIGVSMYRQTTAWWSWERDAALVPGVYLDVMEEAGAEPVLIPPAGEARARSDSRCNSEVEAPRFQRVIAAIDGLVITGGGDISPDRYGRRPDPHNAGTSDQRDQLELGLVAEALRTDLPVLAVCRGMQVLNVLLGGDLTQHLPDQIGSHAHRPRQGEFGRITVVTEEGSIVHRLFGERTDVLCSHHQAVDSLGRGLVATARSVDGTVEAVELAGHRFVVGVQWHPEETGDTTLFEALVMAAGARRDPLGSPPAPATRPPS